ncbi:HD domain-containing protein [Nitratireductor aquimarinus]|uniref:HD domain-containing protein n=1 Tax=Nitratireductor aquimarinus TaxID=889300 RepID=UPI0036F3CCD8
MAREVTEIVRDTAGELLFNHSSRVYLFGAMAGERRGLTYDAELLYTAAMFHDMGLTEPHRSKTARFEVDGANAARVFLQRQGISQHDMDTVWTAMPFRIMPDRGQVSEYSAHPLPWPVAWATKQRCDVLHERECGS